MFVCSCGPSLLLQATAGPSGSQLPLATPPALLGALAGFQHHLLYLPLEASAGSSFLPGHPGLVCVCLSIPVDTSFIKFSPVNPQRCWLSLQTFD